MEACRRIIVIQIYLHGEAEAITLLRQLIAIMRRTWQLIVTAIPDAIRREARVCDEDRAHAADAYVAILSTRLLLYHQLWIEAIERVLMPVVIIPRYL